MDWKVKYKQGKREYTSKSYLEFGTYTSICEIIDRNVCLGTNTLILGNLNGFTDFGAL